MADLKRPTKGRHAILPLAALLSVAIALPLTAQPVPVATQAQVPGLTLLGETQPSPANPRIKLLTFDSTALGGAAAPDPNNPDQIRVVVLLPPNYEPKRPQGYPVIYFYHGAGGSASPAAAVQFQTQLDAMDLQAIVVLPDGGGAGYYTNWFNNGAFGSPEWETFHIGQLLPWIDKNYNTIPERWARATSGFSLGGGGSLRYAARHPDLFGIASSFSGVIDLTQPDIGLRNDPRAAPLVPRLLGAWEDHEIRWRAISVIDLARNLANTDLFISTGDTGPPESTYILHGADALDKRLAELGIAHVRKLYPGVTHGTGPFPPLAEWLPRVKSLFTDPAKRVRTPGAFSYTSIDSIYMPFGWSVALTRKAAEFSTLEVTDNRNFSLTGSGKAIVTTPPIGKPGARIYFRVTIQNVGQGSGKPPAPTILTLTTDVDGRLSFPVTLGPVNAYQQYSPEAEKASTGPSRDSAPFTIRGNGSRFYRANVIIASGQ